MIMRILTLLLLLAMVVTVLPMPETKAVAAAQDTANSDVRIMSANVLAEFASWSGGTAPEATSSRVVKLNKMLEENAPIEAVRRIHVPVIFAHGEDDTLVPCYMSRENYEACTAPKCLYTAPGAGHGLCYLVAGEDYIRALREFWMEQGIYE